MTYKYATELSSLPDCPPSDVAPCDQKAFRFVHSYIEDPRNFLCLSKLNPSRKLKVEHQCNGFALSLFVSQDKAIKRYRELLLSNKNIGKTVGDYLAVGTTKPEDGRTSHPSGNGHFALWEAEVADLAPRFRIVLDLTL